MSTIKLEKRYASLRTIATIYKILGVLVLLVGGVTSILSIIAVGPLALLALAGAVLASVTCFAAAASIDVVLGIEENTRLQVQVLEYMVNSRQGAA